MYNIYQYQEQVRAQEAARSSDENYTKWLIRHEDFKAVAGERAKERADQFLMDQSCSPSRV